MTRSLKTTIFAISIALIALTGIAAAPAQAGSRSKDEFGRFLAGAIALVIIGKAIEETLDAKKPQKVHRPRPPQPDLSRVLPAQCYFPIDTAEGIRGVYGKACLKKNMPNAERLPRFCEETVRVRHGRRAKVYDAGCLSRWGYRAEAPRY